MSRYRRSVKKREQKKGRERQKQDDSRRDGDEGGDGMRYNAEERNASGEEGTHNLDDTTARITSLLQKIEGEESRPGDGKLTCTLFSHPWHRICNFHADHRAPSPQYSSSPSPIPTQPTVGLTIHKTDRLRPEVNITHPLVRVCLVNSDNGELVKKSYPGRCVTSYYEAGVDYIQPVLTQPWRKRGCR